MYRLYLVRPVRPSRAQRKQALGEGDRAARPPRGTRERLRPTRSLTARTPRKPRPPRGASCKPELVTCTTWLAPRKEADVAARAGRARVILRATVGSTVHGLHHGGQDDRDEMAVFVEPPEYRLGLKLARGQGGSCTRSSTGSSARSPRASAPGRATSTWSPTTCASTCGSR